MGFDRQLAGDQEGKCRSLFFSFLTVSLSSVFHTLSLSFLSFLSFYFLFLFPFLLTLPIELFDFLQVRGSFLSLYYSTYHVSPFLWFMCHMDTCSRWYSPHHMALMPCVLLSWFHVVALSHAMWHHPMCHPTPSISKNMKFLPSQNSTKLD